MSPKSALSRITIVTDAWRPQRNGVVRVLESLIHQLQQSGIEVSVISPEMFLTVPMPGYPEIKLSVLAGAKCRRALAASKPEAVHIATEGPLGRIARKWCQKNSYPFTTAYHSKFPEYIQARLPFLSLGFLYKQMLRFHRPAKVVLAPSRTVAAELQARGFKNVVSWAHGVDTQAFQPRGKNSLPVLHGIPRPCHMYVGRVTVDKNIPAFLDLDLPGSKVVVGDGPDREKLMRRYPDVKFIIVNGDDELSRAYSCADVFVFPSRTDTFGLVMLEALACGVPVVAFPVTGPRDVLVAMQPDSPVGVLSDDLSQAVEVALTLPPERCRQYAEGFSWAKVAQQFLAELAYIGR